MTDESLWVEYNPNPTGRRVNDCAVRAVAKALNISWEQAYALIVTNGYAMGDMPSSNSVWGSVLRQHGFYRKIIDNDCPDCYTAKDFLLDHPHGVYVLGFDKHTATAVNGRLYDSWNSLNELPQYYWFRKDDYHGV